MELFNVYSLYPVEPVRGKGCFVYDAAGTEYLDLYGGHAVISIGHAQPDYVRALSEQAARLGFYSNSVENSLQTTLAEKLGRASGYDDYSLFLCNSGAEANENALKLASFHTGRTKVLAFSKALDELAQEGGIPARSRRYTENNRLLIEKMRAMGFATYIDGSHQGPIITTFFYPAGVSFRFEEFYRYIKERGYAIYPGKLTEMDTFRIGNIGEIYPEDIDKLTSVIAAFLKERKEQIA